MWKDFYSLQSKKKRYFFDRVENFERKEPVNTNEYDIEHIMPQTLTPTWKRDLGENYEETREIPPHNRKSHSHRL